MPRSRLLLASLLALLALLVPFLPPAQAREVGPGDLPEIRLADVGLDPGHSDADVGAVGGGLREADLTLAIALRVREILEASGLTVAMSRLDNQPLSDFSALTATRQIQEEQEARIAAVGKVRVYVSLHLNGFGDPRVRGVEGYYNSDNWGEDSRRLAQSIQNRLIEEVRATGYAIPDRGVKRDLAAGKPYGHFFSLRGDMPSVLVEAMFLTNPEEASLLGAESMQETVACGVARGIIDQLMPPVDLPPEGEGG